MNKSEILKWVTVIPAEGKYPILVLAGEPRSDRAGFEADDEEHANELCQKLSHVIQQAYDIGVEDTSNKIGEALSQLAESLNIAVEMPELY